MKKEIIKKIIEEIKLIASKKYNIEHLNDMEIQDILKDINHPLFFNVLFNKYFLNLKGEEISDFNQLFKKIILSSDLNLNTFSLSINEEMKKEKIFESFDGFELSVVSDKINKQDKSYYFINACNIIKKIPDIDIVTYRELSFSLANSMEMGFDYDKCCEAFKYFHDVMLQDIRELLLKENEEKKIEEIKNFLSLFWYKNTNVGYELTNLYKDYLTLLNEMKGQNPIIQKRIDKLKEDEYKSFLIDTKSCLNPHFFREVINHKELSENIINDNGVIKIKKSKLKIFDHQNVFSNSILGNALSKIKHVEKATVFEDLNNDVVEINIKFKDNIVSDPKKNKISKIIVLDFINNLFEYLEDLSINELKVKNKLSKHLREFSLNLDIGLSENKKIDKKRKNKI